MRQKTLQRFEEFRDDPGTTSMLIQRVAEGETLRDVCKSREVPYSLVAKWIAETPSLKAQYDAALQIWGDSLAQETVGLADGVAGADEASHVTAAKLAIETRLKLAGKWDRQRYGEQAAAPLQVNLNILNVTAEIAELEKRLGIGGGVTLLPELIPALPAQGSATEQQRQLEEL